MNKRQKRNKALERLRDAVCAEYQITVEAIRSKSRQHIVVCARRAFCQRAWESMEYSCTEIGEAINRDHTTVLFHCGRTYIARKHSAKLGVRRILEKHHGLH